MYQIPFSDIRVPTLLLDEKQTKLNIRMMAEKAKNQGVRFRPHFKTHQSAQIGEWFRKAGVKAITVSSVRMADYFIHHKWNDVTIAFPVNWREINEINRLVDHNHLELLVESIPTADFLQKNLRLITDVWIKIDVGYHRTGIEWQDREEIENLVDKILSSNKLLLRGFLTHGGMTYNAGSRAEIQSLFVEGKNRLSEINRWFVESRKAGFEISVGDTPGCRVSPGFDGVDEIRPGNFVFYDAMMSHLGVCQPQEISLALACPVVAKHANRSEIIIYGGAVHLSKESILVKGQPIFGLVALPQGERWSGPLEDCFVSGLSQEHGIVKVTQKVFDRLAIGDLVCILPVHSCLTATAMGSYLTLDEESINMMRL